MDANLYELGCIRFLCKLSMFHMNKIVKRKKQSLIFLACIMIFTLIIMCCFLKTVKIKEDLKCDLKRTSAIIFYCDIEGTSIKTKLTQLEKEQLIEIFNKGNMTATYKSSKAFPEYWFKTNKYEIGFLEDVEIIVNKDKNTYRYIPGRNLNYELNQFCKKIAKNKYQKDEY